MKPILHGAFLTAFTLSACAARQPEPAAQPIQDAPPIAQRTQPSQQPAQRTAPVVVATPSTTPTGAWYSRRLVRVYHGNNKDMQWTNEDIHETAVAPVHSSEVLQQVVTACGLSADAVKYVTVEMAENNNRTDVEITVDLSRAPSGTPMAAREVADALVARLKQSVANVVGEAPNDKVVRALEEARAQSQQQLEQATAQLNAMRDRVREQTGRTSASAERMRDEIAQLEDKNQELELELEARAARMAALSKSISKVTAEMEQNVKNDPVSAELQKVVDAREKQVERVKVLVEAGKSEESELNDALSELAEARARVLERRTEAAERAGGASVQEWNRELQALSVDTAELQVRLGNLQERLAKFQSVAGQLDDMEAARHQREEARQMLDHVREQLNELRLHAEGPQRARASVVRSEDRTGDRPERRGSRSNDDEQ
jgi:hypothetical protein